MTRSATSASGSSQRVIYKDKAYFISHTVGQQSITGIAVKNGYTIRQGFQQPPGLYLIGEPAKDSNLQALVFPNPFHQSLEILFREKIKFEIQVHIYDSQGRIITSESHASTQSFNLYLDHIASGSYLLKVMVGDKGFSRTIIKQ